MESTFTTALWKNFGAAIDMLTEAVALCPDELWYREKRFFYLTYHTVIFLDYYLTIPVTGFQPTLPYTIVDSDKLPPEAVDDVMPNELYSRQDVLGYLSSIREKCKRLITHATEEKLMERWVGAEEINLHGLCPPIVENYTVLDILFYNFRHVQHHVAQMNTILRQKINAVPDWVSHAD